MGLGAQALEIVHEPVAGVLRVLVVHADVDRLLGADLLAVAAEHAAELVDLVNQRVAVALFVLAGDELDAVGRADLGAQAARHALGAPLLVGEHAVRAAPPRGDRPILAALLLGVLHRDLGPEQMAQGERHAPEGRAQVRGLGDRPLEDFHADGHQAPPSATELAIRCPRSSTKNSGMASRTFNPHSVRANRRSYVHPSPSCSTQIAVASSAMYTSASGSITFQPSAMSWS